MKKTIIVLLTIISVLFVAVLYLLYLNLNKTTPAIISTFSQNTGIIPTEKATPTSPVSETANWKTYAYNKCGDWPADQTVNFTYKLPSEMTETISNKFSCCTSYTYSSADLSITFTCGDGFGVGGCGLTNELVQDKFKTFEQDINGCLEKNEKNLNLRLTYVDPVSTDSSNHPSISITAQSIDSTKNRQLINQIISTFKFINLNTPISSSDLAQGWYWGSENQKKSNTPANWVFTEAGRSSCWHAPDKECRF